MRGQTRRLVLEAMFDSTRDPSGSGTRERAEEAGNPFPCPSTTNDEEEE